MASGDVIETIELVDSNLALNMNNSKEISGFHETGEGGEPDGKYWLYKLLEKAQKYKF